MLFETKRLYVAKWNKENLQSLYEIYKDDAIKEFIQSNPTIEETKHIFENQLKNYDTNFPFGRYFIVEKCSNEFIGLFLLKRISNAAEIEIGYSLIKKHWRKGYATEIVRKGISWLDNLKRFSTINAVTTPNNINSQKVLLKCGFSQKNGFIEMGQHEFYFSLSCENIS